MALIGLLFGGAETKIPLLDRAQRNLRIGVGFKVEGLALNPSSYPSLESRESRVQGPWGFRRLPWASEAFIVWLFRRVYDALQ